MLEDLECALTVVVGHCLHDAYRVCTKLSTHSGTAALLESAASAPAHASSTAIPKGSYLYRQISLVHAMAGKVAREVVGKLFFS